MSFNSEQSFFREVLFDVFKKEMEVVNISFLSGGCINNTLKLITSEGPFFLKWQIDIPNDMFEKERLGLELLHQSAFVPLPEVYGCGKIGGKNYLLMQYLDSSSQGGRYWEELGQALANQHKNTSNSKYGLDHDNYIGRLPQKNDWKAEWIDFFINERLESQLLQALRQSQVDTNFANRYRKFYTKLPNLLPVAPPSLLHGDLWSGNVMTGPDGKAWVIDPAVYFGHREIELSFTRMFGGFGGGFYEAYQSVWPLDPGFDARVDIYNMYPSMVHVNLFGQSYLSGVESVLRKYL